jgi:hypothetical protein
VQEVFGFVKRNGGTCAGLAMDAKNNILFATCRMPANMVILSATDGKIITTLPINGGTDGALFNPIRWKRSARTETARWWCFYKRTPA